MKRDVVKSRLMSRFFQLTVLATLALGFSACTTERTVTTRESSYSIKDGSESGSLNRKTIGNFMTDKDGNLVPTRKDADGKMVPDKRKMDLYSSDSREGKKEYKSKAAKLGGREFEAKMAKTPEFIERQQAKENKKSSRNSDFSSRESDFAGNRATESGGTSRAEGQASFFERLNPFRAESQSSANDTLDVKSNRTGTRAIGDSVIAVPNRTFGETDLGEGNRADQRSIDDVKRLLSPGKY